MAWQLYARAQRPPWQFEEQQPAPLVQASPMFPHTAPGTALQRVGPPSVAPQTPLQQVAPVAHAVPMTAQDDAVPASVGSCGWRQVPATQAKSQQSLS